MFVINQQLKCKRRGCLSWTVQRELRLHWAAYGGQHVFGTGNRCRVVTWNAVGSLPRVLLVKRTSEIQKVRLTWWAQAP